MGKKLLGKFNDVLELQKAYTALESAYTKKCQEFKKIETANSDNGITSPDIAFQTVTAEKESVADTVIAADITDINEAANGADNVVLSGGSADCLEPLVNPSEACEALPEIAASTVTQAAILSQAETTVSETEPEKTADTVTQTVTVPQVEPAANNETVSEPATDIVTQTVTVPQAESSEANSKKEPEALGDELKQRIISEYLLELAQSRVPHLLTGGQGKITLLPPKKPKNLTEAAELAEQVLRK